MSIRCVCQNGHVLKVKESLAGRSGLCPSCKAVVKVPHLQQKCISEDAILDLLGNKAPRQGLLRRVLGCCWPPPIRGFTDNPH